MKFAIILFLFFNSGAAWKLTEGSYDTLQDCLSAVNSDTFRMYIAKKYQGMGVKEVKLFCQPQSAVQGVKQQS